MIRYITVALAFMSLVLSQNVIAARYALVVGNATYESAPLTNPINDANAISSSLSNLGFDVTKVTNASRRDLYRAVQSFRQKLGRDDIALFYYSGHGVEVKGNNYLLPVNNSVIRTQEDVPIEALAANDVLRQMEASGT